MSLTFDSISGGLTQTTDVASSQTLELAMRIRREMAPSTMNTMYTVEMITVHIAPNKIQTA